MKQITIMFIVLLIAGVNSFSQKKNGVIFSEHEAISKTRELWKAALSGDEAKYRSYFADSAFIVRNSNNPPKTANDQIGKGMAKWNSEFENLKIEDQKPAYPDALEYKEGGTWVQDWLIMTGIHKKTGIVVEVPVHNLYSFDEDGKVAMLASYFDNSVFEEIDNSQKIKENGTVYINHPNIVTVRKTINAFVARDMEEWASHFSPEARFTTSSMKMFESRSLEEHKQSLIDMYFKDELKYKVEQVGYPDCVHYAKSDQFVVYSWWKMDIKKDGKKHEIPIMLSHDFNDDGKIVFTHVYTSSNHFEDL